MYGLLSVAGLLGLRSGTGVTGGAVLTTVILAGLGAIAAVGFGYYQATQEREKELRRIEEQARERADRAIREALRVWLDRCKDKLQQKMQEELRVLRSALQTWYNAEVLPAHDRALAEQERARKVEEEAKDKTRNLAERRKKIDSLREKIKAAQVLVDGPALA
jgi:type II secretory pathway pseudopilin PulG